MKIAIIGYSGSGKSTLAKKIGSKYTLPVLHLDSVNFTNNWQERDHQEALTIVKDFMSNDNWVIDGSYVKFLQKERFQQADHIIFLNFNRLTCFFRNFKRYLKYRNTTRDDMAEGCNEKFDFEFISWLLWKGRSKARKEHFASIVEEYSEKIVVLNNQKETDQFLLDFTS